MFNVQETVLFVPHTTLLLALRVLELPATILLSVQLRSLVVPATKFLSEVQSRLLLSHHTTFSVHAIVLVNQNIPFNAHVTLCHCHATSHLLQETVFDNQNTAFCVPVLLLLSHVTILVVASLVLLFPVTKE